MKIILLNKKANYSYFIKDKYDAGIVLLGSEVKSIKSGRSDISNSYVFYNDGAFWVSNMKISPYKGSLENHDELRLKKLLLSKNEINKLRAKSEQKGMTIIPTKVFLSDRNLIKITIALAEGKKVFDKRETIKKRDWDRNKLTLLKR